MAKVKESKVEKQQRSDAAEQAHRLAHELGLDHDHLHEEGTSHPRVTLWMAQRNISLRLIMPEK